MRPQQKEPIMQYSENLGEKVKCCPYCSTDGREVILRVIWQTISAYPHTHTEPVGLDCPQCRRKW